MEDNDPMICSTCNRSMDPVELRDVPVDELKDFLSEDGNRLEDNWYWCSECDSYNQCPLPKMLTPEGVRL